MAASTDGRRRTTVQGFSLLSIDELQYELEIRGLPHQLHGTRGVLAALMYRSQHSPPVIEQCDKLDPSEERDALLPKMAELQKLVKEAPALARMGVDPARSTSLFPHVV